MMRVAVSQRVDYIAERDETRDALDQRLVAWLARTGALAFPVPNRWIDQGILDRWLTAVAPHGVLLSGGHDIGATGDRDDTERALLRWAQGRRLPVLGLCRGMQMMAAFAGGEIARVAGHAGTRHALAHDAPDLPLEVNSFHHCALRDAPPGYEILARASDGTVEAMRHTSLPWEGWMWHPEREAGSTGREQARLRALLSQSGATQ